MKKIIRLTESELIKVIKKLIKEEEPKNSDLYSSILGYLDKHGENIVQGSNDKLNTMGIKKEVMKFCFLKRENKSATPLSKQAQALFSTIDKLVKESNNISYYIELGKDIEVNLYT